MDIGHQVMSWRRCRGLTQLELAHRTGLTRPYLSRLESGDTDPALSSLRRLAAAMELPLGQLIDGLPPAKQFGRLELDRLARESLHPGTGAARKNPEARALARIIRDRRRALGLYRPRKSTSAMGPTGKHAARWFRARLGEAQWNALLKRIDKLISFYAR